MEPSVMFEKQELKIIPNTVSPFFSIIIPTLNRSSLLFACLKQIENLIFSLNDFEVLVVNDGGDKNEFIEIQNYNWKINLALIHLKKNHGPACARNIGSELAKGKYLYFLDDDCQSTPNILNVVKEYALKFKEVVMGGEVINALKTNIFSETSQCLVDYIYFRMNNNYQDCVFFTSNNFCISRKLFLQIGGFDHRFTIAAAEDREFCNRLICNNVKLHFIKDAGINHFHEMNLKSFTNQHFNYGRGAFFFHKYKKNNSQKNISFHHLLLFVYACRIKGIKIVKSIKMILLLLLSQIAYLLGFCYELRRLIYQKLNLISIHKK